MTRMLLTRLASLKDELDGIDQTEEELHTILEHVVTLENVLKGAMKPAKDLKKAGVTRKRLAFEPAKVAALTSGLTTDTEAEIADLHLRIKKIYARVNMDHEHGSRMILDAILLALAEISSTTKSGIAILPETRIAQGDGVQISHPISYAVIKYDNVRDYKDRLLGPGASQEDVFAIAKNCLFLVEAKRQSLERTIVSYIPEAVRQAIGVLESANLLESENGTLTYYESATRRLSRGIVENSDVALREIVLLLREWLSPTATEIFTLE